MSEPNTCNEKVYPRERYGSFKGHRCGRPAKFVCIVDEVVDFDPLRLKQIQGLRCGIHAKRFDKKKPLP
jgi:hypothetical protein